MQVPRKKKDIKILHLENIYVIIVYKERGEIMGLFSKSKPKESEWVEFHPEKPFNKIKRVVYNEKTNDIKSGEIWSAGWEFTNLKNIFYLVDKIDAMSDKLDQLLVQNKELQKRCEILEKEAEIKRR